MKAKNSTDLAKWVEDYTPELYSWAPHKTSDEELARDLVQDTFMAVAEKISSFKGESSEKTYLFSILNHKIIDHYRKKIHQPVNLENHSLSLFFDEHGEWRNEKKPRKWHEHEENLLDDDEFQSVLQNCINALPEKWNACVTSKYLMDKKPQKSVRIWGSLLLIIGR